MDDDTPLKEADSVMPSSSSMTAVAVASGDGAGLIPGSGARGETNNVSVLVKRSVTQWLMCPSQQQGVLKTSRGKQKETNDVCSLFPHAILPVLIPD